MVPAMTEPKRYDHAPRLPEDLVVPVSAVLPGDGPLMIEVGPGRGLFTRDYATQHPDHRVLALEIRRKWATLLDERLAKHRLANARCFAEDANAALPRLGPDGCARFAAVHFPDPWWKKRHAKRLVVRDTLVVELARLVAEGGTVLVQTDVEDRAEMYLARFSSSPCWAPGGDDGGWHAAESPFAPARSNREARALEDGLPVWRIVLRRTAAPAARVDAPDEVG
jgi:tRNA (guanine-N7-)-methyltransferase